MEKVSDELRSEAIRALAGADYVREKLLTLLNTGPDNIGRSAYAIKCRVKDETSLINKVIYKRKVEKKKSYSPDDATDIVGLRLLALSNEQLPIIVEKFVQFIRFCQSQNVGLFEGHSTGQAISEVKIYKTKTNPVVYNKIFSYLMALNLRDEHGSPEIDLKESDLYSSVHFICKANSFYSKTPRPVSVEVQIRTVFEDAWAEIDHSRRYKGDSYLNKNDWGKHRDLKHAADAFLSDLKADVDRCLRLTDSIENLYSELSQTFRRRTAVTIKYAPSGVRLDYTKAISEITPKTMKSDIAKIDRSIVRIGKNIFSKSSDGQSERALSRAINALDKVRNDYKSRHPNLYTKDRNFNYYYKMEKAFLLMWKNRTLNRRDISEIQKNNKNALELYLELDRDSQFVGDAILKFRLSAAASVAGSDDLAQAKLREAVSALKKDSRIPKNNVLRVTIPRQYSYRLWQRKQEIWHTGARTGDFNFRLVEQETILADCHRYIKDCLRQLKKVATSPEKEIEELRTWNNYISYCWELRELGSRLWILDPEELDQIRNLLPRLEQKRKKYTRELSGLDTILKASNLIHDQARTTKYAKLVRAELRVQNHLGFSEYSRDELSFVDYCLRKIETGK